MWAAARRSPALAREIVAVTADGCDTSDSPNRSSRPPAVIGTKVQWRLLRRSYLQAGHLR